MLRFSTLSREYVRVPLAATEDGTAVDPTSDQVELAIVATGSAPVSGDWTTGEWESDATTTPATRYARIEIGPNSTLGALAAGVYDCWVRVTDTPEVPVLLAGSIELF